MSRTELLKKWTREVITEIEIAKKNQNFYLKLELEFLYGELKRMFDKQLR